MALTQRERTPAAVSLQVQPDVATKMIAATATGVARASRR